MYKRVSMAGAWPGYRIKAVRESGLFVGISSVCFSRKRSFRPPNIDEFDRLLSATSGSSSVYWDRQPRTKTTVLILQTGSRRAA